MLSNVINILYYSGLVFYFLPVLMIFSKRRLNISPLFYFTSINLISVFISYYFTLRFSNSYPVFHLSVPINSVFMLRYFQLLEQNSRISFKLGYFSIALVFLIDLIYSGIWYNNIVTTLFTNVLFTFLSCKSLLFLLKSNNDFELVTFESKFYILISILILNSSSFFFSILETEIRNDTGDFFSFSISFLLVINILFNIFISIGLWKQNKVY
ncbi:MAG: hypothetical protein RL264_2305 [Bacteroidota bacterium]|jgi:hypothetical protein